MRVKPGEMSNLKRRPPGIREKSLRKIGGKE